MKNVTHESRKAAGLCVDCGAKPALPGHVRCAECAQAMREYSALRYTTLKAEHRCGHCGRRMRETWEGTVCRKCLEAQQKRRRKDAKARRLDA